MFTLQNRTDKCIAVSNENNDPAFLIKVIKGHGVNLGNKVIKSRTKNTTGSQREDLLLVEIFESSVNEFSV